MGVGLSVKAVGNIYVKNSINILTFPLVEYHYKHCIFVIFSEYYESKNVKQNDII